MIINGKEIRFLYSIGARCNYEEYCINHPKVSVTRAIVNKAIIMNRAYNDANGTTDTVSEREILSLPNRELEKLAVELDEQEKADSAITVEVEEVEGKNAKSADQ